MKLCCEDKIGIGNNVLVSWETLVMDTDFHHTVDSISLKKTFKYTAPIRIGNNVWIGTRTVILKVSIIPDRCICGASSLICKRFDEQNVLLAGNPATVRKRNISLYRDDF